MSNSKYQALVSSFQRKALHLLHKSIIHGFIVIVVSIYVVIRQMKAIKKAYTCSITLLLMCYKTVSNFLLCLTTIQNVGIRKKI